MHFWKISEKNSENPGIQHFREGLQGMFLQADYEIVFLALAANKPQHVRYELFPQSQNLALVQALQPPPFLHPQCEGKPLQSSCNCPVPAAKRAQHTQLIWWEVSFHLLWKSLHHNTRVVLQWQLLPMYLHFQYLQRLIHIQPYKLAV